MWIEEIYGPGYVGKKREKPYWGYQLHYGEHFSSKYRNITSLATYQKQIPYFKIPLFTSSGLYGSEVKDGILSDHQITPLKEIYVRLGYEGMGHPSTQASLFVNIWTRNRRPAVADFHQ